MPESLNGCKLVSVKKIETRFILFIVLFLLVIGIPSMIAPKLAGEGYTFNGFLYNPIDGNSYLAKMVEGARGDWKFTLPYTAEPGSGAYIFLFYILLGKFAGLLGIPMIIAFHITRVLCSLYLLIELHRFCRSLFPADDQMAWRSFVLAALFTGMGWLGIIFQRLTPDLITPEAYTFLAAYANPHFPLSLGLILLTLRKTLLQPAKNWSIWFLPVGFLLANLSPFSIVVTTAHHWVLQGMGMDQRAHLRGEQRISFWDRRRTGGGLSAIRG